MYIHTVVHTAKYSTVSNKNRLWTRANRQSIGQGLIKPDDSIWLSNLGTTGLYQHEKYTTHLAELQGWPESKKQHLLTYHKRIDVVPSDNYPAITQPQSITGKSISW